MFGKKILSLVALLFVSSQVSNVLGTPIEKCTSTQHNVSVETNCAATGAICFDETDSKVYDFKNTDCKKVADGAFVIDSDKAIINLGTDEISTGSSYDMYYCDGTACVATNGYVLNGASYYKIQSGANAADGAPANVASATTCAGNVGKLVQAGGTGAAYLCLTQNKSVKLAADSAGSYLGLNLARSIFELSATAADNTKVVITGKANALVVDKLYTNAESHCYDASDASIMPRIDNFCEGTNCDKYYVCTSGVCTLQSNACPRAGDGSKDNANADTIENESCDPTVGTNCDEGYYLYDSGLKVKDADEGTFYHCDGLKQAACSTTIPSLGYFVNAAYDAEEAVKDAINHNAQYIKCTGTTPGDCTAYNAASGSCNVDGLVYESEGHIHLCLDSTGTISVQLDGSTAENTDYFIKAGGAGNIFGNSGKYTLININDGIVTPSQTAAGPLYKYANSSYKVLTKKPGVCNYDGKLYEFGLICDGETGYVATAVLYESKASKDVTQSP